LSNLSGFSKIFHFWKHMKFASKAIRQYPPHLRHVCTLPWEIKNSNFLQIFSRYGRKSKQIAFWVHRWISVSRDISRTVLWVCGLSSWLETKSLTVSTHAFFSVGTVRSALPGCLSTVRMSRNFFNSLLTPHFVQFFSGNPCVNLFAVYPFKYKRLSKSCPVAEYHVDCWQVLQWRLLWWISGGTNWS